MTNLRALQDIILAYPDQEVRFSEPLVISLPSGDTFECHAVCAHEERGVWLLDETGEWYELEETDQNAQLIIDSISERLKAKEAVAA